MSGMKYRDRCDESRDAKQRGGDETESEPDMAHADEV